jgi:hypothetical protein
VLEWIALDQAFEEFTEGVCRKCIKFDPVSAPRSEGMGIVSEHLAGQWAIAPEYLTDTVPD